MLLAGQNPETGESVIPPRAIFRAAEGVTVERAYARVPEVSVSVYGGGQSQYAYQGHNVSGLHATYDSASVNCALYVVR